MDYTLSSPCGLLSPTCRSSNFISFKGIWKGIVPPRMEVFCWLAIVGRINTRGVLVRRGIIGVEEGSCPVSSLETASVEHLVIHCQNH